MTNHPGFQGLSGFSEHGMLGFKSRNVLGKQNKLVTLARKVLINLSCHTSLSAALDFTSGKEPEEPSSCQALFQSFNNQYLLMTYCVPSTVPITRR